MPIRLIVHSITKNQNSDVAYVQKREALIQSDGFATKFIDDLRTAINHKNPRSGRFKQPAGVSAPFQLRVSKYLASASDAEFIKLSSELTDHLVALMRPVAFATGGYVLFVEHDYGEDKYLLVLILSTKAGASFNEKLDLTASPVIDLEHLRHAARIHEGEVSTNPDGVIKFVSRGDKDTAGYFLDFLGCEAVTNSAEQGNLLKAALKVTCAELGINLEEARQATHAYWTKCREKSIMMQLSTLANCIDPADPTRVLNALTRENFRLAGEFDAPHPRIMNQLVKFSYAADDLKIEFDRGKWIGLVTIEGRSTIKIRRAPSTLVKEIEEAKKIDADNGVT